MVFKRYTAETKAIHPRSLSDASWERVQALSGRRSATRELEQEFARRYDRDATFLARWNQGWTRRAAARGDRAHARARPGEEDRRRLLARALGREHVLRPRPLRRPGGVVRRVGARRVRERPRELDRQAAPRERLEAQARRRQRRARRARRRSASTSASCRRTCRLLEPDTDISTWSLFDVTDFGVTIRGSIGFELPCFGKPALTAGTGFYSGRGFTVDSETADEYLRPARADPGARRRRRGERRARAEARVRAVHGCARRASRAFARSTSRSRRSTTRSRRRSRCSCATRTSWRGRRTYAGSASGPSAPASSTTSSCRSFVSMRGSSSSGSSVVARRGSVVRPAAQPSSPSSRSVVSLRLPYG